MSSVSLKLLPLIVDLVCLFQVLSSSSRTSSSSTRKCRRPVISRYSTTWAAWPSELVVGFLLTNWIFEVPAQLANLCLPSLFFISHGSPRQVGLSLALILLLRLAVFRMSSYLCRVYIVNPSFSLSCFVCCCAPCCITVYFYALHS